MIQVNRIYLIFNRLVTKKFLVDTSDQILGIMTNIASSAHFKEELYSFFVCKYFKRGFS